MTGPIDLDTAFREACTALGEAVVRERVNERHLADTTAQLEAALSERDTLQAIVDSAPAATPPA